MTKELIAKLEALEEPDRDIDAEIAVYIHGGSVDSDGRFWKPGVRGFSIAERYTASIDAAIMLVPDDMCPVLDFNTGEARIYRKRYDSRFFVTEHNNPAIALLICILKAKEPVE